MHLRYENLESVKSGSTMTNIYLDECMKCEIKRLIELKKLLDFEHELCNKSVLKKPEKSLNIPNDIEIEKLRRRCKELNQLLDNSALSKAPKLTLSY